MAIIARINGVDMPVIEASITWELDAAEDFEIEVAAQGFDWRTAYNAPVALLRDGQVLVSGLVALKPEATFNNEAAQITLKCMGEFARLTRLRALGDAKYQDAPVIGILLDLLPDGWTLDVVNMDDPTVTTTIDLRQKNQRFGQIVQLVESIPYFHLRYGGINDAGLYVLAVGNFNTVTTALHDGNLIDELQISPGQNDVLREIEAFCNSADNVITLEDVVTPGTANSLAAAHPLFADFPISQASDGAWIVTNNAVDAGLGGAIRKSFSGVKLGAEPTDSDLNEAGFALWLNAVQHLIVNSDYEVYSASAALADTPHVGDRTHIRLMRAERVRDSLSGLYTQQAQTLALDTEIRITSVSHDLMQQTIPSRVGLDAVEPVAVFDLEMSGNDHAEVVDNDLRAINQLEADVDDDEETKTLPAVMSDSTTHGIGDLPDGSCSPLTAKSYSVAAPTPPGGVTEVFTWYEVTPGAARVTVTGAPATPGDGWIACVESPGGGWSPSGDITVTVYFQYR